MTRLTLLVLASLTLLTGCFPLTFSPLYRGEEDILSVDGLEGEWVLQDANDLPEHWSFVRQDGQPGYLLTIRTSAEEGEPTSAAMFRAAPVEVDGRRFLDLAIHGHEPEMNTWFAFHVPPTRSVWRLELEGDGLRLTAPNQKLLFPMLREKPDATPHRVVGENPEKPHDENDRLLLLGDTEELRRFIATLDDATYFSDSPLNFRRATATAEAAEAAEAAPPASADAPAMGEMMSP